MPSVRGSCVALGLLAVAIYSLFAPSVGAYAGNIASSGDGLPGYITSAAWGAGSDSTAPAGFPADDFGGCTGCHGAHNAAPTAIQINGTTLSTSATPTAFTVSQGTTTTFTVQFTNDPSLVSGVAGTGKTGGGFHVMHNDTSSGNANGALSKVPGDGTVHQCQGAATGSGSTTCGATLNNNAEVMHEVPKGNDGSNHVVFQFRYTANATTVCSTFEFGLWVNAVNLDNLCFGSALDNPVFRRFRITTNCDDSNLCTNDSCNGGSCGHTNNSLACNDLNACTTSDTCSGGSCVGGAAPNCNDNNACTNDTCSVLFGCQHANNTSACSDGNACTTGDTCSGGSCIGGAAPNCNDANGCTDDSCNPISGCVHTNNAASCSDGNACTTGDTCSAAACVGGAAPNCNDANGCTDDSCNAISGCVHTNNAASCSDGNACTTGDTCSGGICAGGGATNCNDGNACTDDSCNSVSGCVHTNNSVSCSDGNACTTGDICSGGTCVGGAAPNCNDGNVCTDDSCSPATGCVHANNTAACSDGNACTTGDACSGGACVGGAGPNCNDGNPCTDDSCTPGTGCVHVNNTAPCNDGNACTTSDTCSSGACAGGASPSCDDLEVCTTDTCNPGTGCVHTPLVDDTACGSDGNICTFDLCKSGKCHQPVPAGVTQCRAAACAGTIPNAVETHQEFCNGTAVCPGPNTQLCGSATPCNGTACQGSCSVDANCPSGFFCASGSCLPVLGAGKPCTRTPMCDGTSSLTCVDNVCCKTACGGGVTTDCQACDNTGTCQPLNAVGCSDGNACTTGDTCTAGTCSAGASASCSDGNGCTDDSCNTTTGCVHTNNTASCSDGNACTTSDTCAAGACIGGAAPNCNDGNGCTDDACNTTTGCAHTNNTASCSDGNACTTSDTCAAGACIGGAAPNCNDGNGCTDDSCNTTTGCVHANNAAPCSDGNACTLSDKCTGGACVGGAAPNCDDGNPCTADACDSTSGCKHPAGNAGSPCRPKNGVCDVAEACDGTSPSCPGDVLLTGTQCSPPSCTTGTQTLAAVCDGKVGSCPTPATKSCGGFVCGATACLTTCTASADCAQGYYCGAGGQCVPKGNAGASCAAGGQCASGFCTDGVCCNNDCTGQCEACTLVGKVGTCSAVTGNPVAPRSACPGDHTGCDGRCNGIDPAACTMPAMSTQCRPPSCASGTATLAESCDGSGKCPGVRTQDCAPGICGPTQCEGCTTNASCGAGKFCRGGVCNPRAGNGTACSQDDECTSKHCVDGACCNEDCSGQCEACNVSGSEGTCKAVSGKPVGGRPSCNTGDGSCDGTCDGSARRTCTYPGLGVPCRAAGCVSSTRATVAAFCDGNGRCPPDEERDCASGTLCTDDRCTGAAACGGDGDCNSGQYCSAGVCVAQKTNGANCNASSECASSFCVDGVCCTEACSGQCEACDVAGSAGVCVPVSGAPHGSRQLCASDGSTCAGRCDGSGRTTCAYSGASVSCRPGSCANGVATLAGSCQGNGECAPLQLQDCGAADCAAAKDRCAGGCGIDSDCASDEYCSAGVCVPRLANAEVCGSTTQCTSGHCVDGVCCDTACTAQCESCSQGANIGTCTAVAGAPRGGRAACAGSGACGGFCDGAVADRCSLPGSTAVCGEGACTIGFAIGAPTCLNTLCLFPTSIPCDPYVCDPATKACLSSCAVDDDCAIGLVCTSGQCAQPPNGGDAGRRDAGSDAAAGNGGTGGVGGAAASDATAPPASGGAAGKPATGGAAGAAGAAGMRAAGGAPSGAPDAGASPDGGQGKGSPSSKDEGSCGCRAVGQERAGSTLGAVLLGLGLLAARGRRGKRRRAARGTTSRRAFQKTIC